MKKLILALCGLCLSNLAVAQDTLKVVTSVKPLQLVAQAIVADLGEVDSLVPAGASPHHYALRPSDIRILQAADLVVWVGPEMEQFLSKPIGRLDVPTVQLLENADVHSESGHADAHDTHAEHEGEHHHHGDIDPHVWMDPLQMMELASTLQQELTKLAPAKAEQLAANFERFAAQLLQTDRAIRAQLKPYEEKGFIVFHDAYALLVAHYGLHQRAYFTVDPAQAPGAKKLSRIQNLIKEEGVTCVFVEPQFKAAVIERIIADLPVNLGKLDPLAISVSAEQGYPGYLQQLADEIETCLQ